MSNKIIWLIPNININQASVRLRCLYFAYELEKKYTYNSIFCQDIKDAIKKVERNSTVVIAKHLSGDLIPALAKANELNCTIIYDVTDNITYISYKSNS